MNDMEHGTRCAGNEKTNSYWDTNLPCGVVSTRIFLRYNSTVATKISEEGWKRWRKVGTEECNGGTAV